MKITKVKFYPVKNRMSDKAPLALCSVVFDGEFMIHDVKIFANGVVVMPQKYSKKADSEGTNTHKSDDLCHPISKDFFMYMRDMILEGYEFYANGNIGVFEPEVTTVYS